MGAAPETVFWQICPGRVFAHDGIHYVPASLGRRYLLGLLVVQKGEAPEPAETGDINGYPFDGVTHFKYVNSLDTLAALRR